MFEVHSEWQDRRLSYDLSKELRVFLFFKLPVKSYTDATENDIKFRATTYVAAGGRANNHRDNVALDDITWRVSSCAKKIQKNRR